MSPSLLLKPQEPPIEQTHSMFMGQLVSTPAALREFGILLIIACHGYLRNRARCFRGIDYLQVFTDPKNDGRALWFIDDGDHVTALLPEDY